MKRGRRKNRSSDFCTKPTFQSDAKRERRFERGVSEALDTNPRTKKEGISKDTIAYKKLRHDSIDSMPKHSFASRRRRRRERNLKRDCGGGGYEVEYA